MSEAGSNPIVLHASAVAFGTQGLLITGASGAGKSALAIELMALGAELVADDRVVVASLDGALRLSAPDSIRGRIEARGLGVMRAEPAVAWARAVVDLDEVETERLPPARETVIAGVTIALIRKVETRAFPSMLRLMMTGGREDVG